MVLEADRNGCVREVMVIAAALSIQDPRERPVEHQQAQADQQHARFADQDSDFLAYLNLWQLPAEQQKDAVVQRVPPDVQGGVPQLPAGPRVAGHLRPAAPGRPSLDLGTSSSAARTADRGSTTALLAGLLSHIGMKDGDKREYVGRPRRQVRHLPGLGAVQEAAPVR